MFQNVFKIAAGLIFVVAVVTSMFALGSSGRIGFEYLLGVDNCYYQNMPMKVDREAVAVSIDQDYLANCKRDTTNNNKRTAADSLAMLLVALPTSIFFYRKVRDN